MSSPFRPVICLNPFNVKPIYVDSIRLARLDPLIFFFVNSIFVNNLLSYLCIILIVFI